jgi:diguanylate cyclase (GGDEF)-like protein
MRKVLGDYRHVLTAACIRANFWTDCLVLAAVVAGSAAYGAADSGGGALFGGLSLAATLYLVLRLKSRNDVRGAQPDLSAVDDLRLHNARITTALNHMSQGLCMFDSDKNLILSNDQYAWMYGIPPEYVQPGTSFRQVLQNRIDNGLYKVGNPEDYLRERIAAVEERRASVKVQQLTDGRAIAISHRPMQGGGWVATHDDITEIQRIEAKIAHMAHHDGLTDLPNRVLFREELDGALARVRRGQQLSVLCLDLDRFKAVNDTLGHPIGDGLLKAVAERLLNVTRESDIVARLGGDEFAILQVGLEKPDEATVLAERIIKSLSKPFEIDGHQLAIGTSIGIAVAPSDSEEADQLLKLADMALFRAKRDGRGTYRFFQPEMDAEMQSRRALELDLRKALANGEFELYYQPLVNIQANRVTGLEALLRWHQPERGTVLPNDFIPLAEEIGLIGEIGAWVLKEACAEAAKWPADVRLAVNLSPVQFKGGTLVLHVLAALEHSGLPADRLELEITERVMLHDAESTLATLHDLRALGLRIAMDDFGTGYSSVSYLRKFPFDRIKIDQSFVQDLPDQADAVAIVQALAGLGSSLGMSTTAEGVESIEQLAKLRAEGCTEVQGYFFSPAKPASEIAGLLTSVADKSRSAARRSPRRLSSAELTESSTAISLASSPRSGSGRREPADIAR